MILCSKRLCEGEVSSVRSVQRLVQPDWAEVRESTIFGPTEGEAVWPCVELGSQTSSDHCFSL